MGHSWSLRQFCDKTCKYKLAHQVSRQRDAFHVLVREARGTVPDFGRYNVNTKDGGPMPKIDRALPEDRSAIASTLGW